MSAFSPVERTYLAERRLARLATVGRDGMPHVTPVGMWRHNSDADSIDITGHAFAASKKYRDVAASGVAAIVVDDLASTDPWRPRGVEVRGHAEVIEAPEPLIRIHPDRVRSWGLDPQPLQHAT
jgi:pyridoxamine 5'-phosphate oxidase family protein